MANPYTISTVAAPNYYKMFFDGRKPVYEIGDAGPSNKVVGEKPTASGYAGAIGIGVSIGQGIGNAIGGYMIASATASQLLAQASISTDNAGLAQMAAEQAFRAGEAQLAQIGFKQAETKARQRVAFAASGVALGVGSTAEVAASADIQAEVDKATARTNALAAAWGYRRQKAMALAQAEGQRIMAHAYRNSGRVGMYAGLASTAISAFAGFASGGK